MKSVMISIKPKWCELIANGKKTVEVRKTRPKIKTPFKVYIYCTRARNPIRDSGRILMYEDDLAITNRWGQCKRVENPCGAMMKEEFFLNGKVIGEFVCDEITKFAVDEKIDNILLSNMGLKSCLGCEQLEQYAEDSYYLYGWNISNLVIYDKPKDLDDFMAFGKTHCDQKNCKKCLYMGIDGICDVKDIGQPMTRPPQSWCYCEELN